MSRARKTPTGTRFFLDRGVVNGEMILEKIRQKMMLCCRSSHKPSKVKKERKKVQTPTRIEIRVRGNRKSEEDEEEVEEEGRCWAENVVHIRSGPAHNS